MTGSAFFVNEDNEKELQGQKLTLTYLPGRLIIYMQVYTISGEIYATNNKNTVMIYIEIK